MGTLVGTLIGVGTLVGVQFEMGKRKGRTLEDRLLLVQRGLLLGERASRLGATQVSTEDATLYYSVRYWQRFVSRFDFELTC